MVVDDSRCGSASVLVGEGGGACGTGVYLVSKVVFQR